MDARIQDWLAAFEANNAADYRSIPPPGGGRTPTVLKARKAERAGIRSRLQRMSAEDLRQLPTADPDASCLKAGGLAITCAQRSMAATG